MNISHQLSAISYQPSANSYQLSANSQAEKVNEVARQFEAVLLRQILTDAQKKLFPDGLSPESASSGIYQDMITNQLAEGMSRAGGFGLARVLAKQLLADQ